MLLRQLPQALWLADSRIHRHCSLTITVTVTLLLTQLQQLHSSLCRRPHTVQPLHYPLVQARTQ
jgi:hypothetical protein